MLMVFPQLIDYDRYNNSLTKLRDKKEKSLSDEKNLFKVRFMKLKVLLFPTSVSLSKTLKSRPTSMNISIQL